MGVSAYPAYGARSSRQRYARQTWQAPAAAAAPVKARWRWTFVPYLVAVLMLAGTAAYAFAWPQGHVQPAAPGTEHSLVWGDGIFAKRTEMKAWLGLHGASYRLWAQTHPAALRLIPTTR